MNTINGYLMTIFTNEQGEAFTVLQLLHQLANKIGEGATADVKALEEAVTQLETDVGTLAQTIATQGENVADLQARLAMVESTVVDLNDELIGVTDAVNTLNGEIVGEPTTQGGVA